MNIKLYIEDNTTLTRYEVQDLVIGDVTINNSLFESTGKIEFEIIDTEYYNVANGNTIYFYVNDVGIFKGYVFKIEPSLTGVRKLKITAYNQLRYLKYKDTISMPELTASQVFEKICKDYNIKYKVLEYSNVKVPSKIYKDKTLYEMINETCEETLRISGKWYSVREHFGVLEFINIANEHSNIILSDSTFVTTGTFSQSIDEDTYNQIKLVKDNENTGKRDVYIVKDSKNINKWGLLQYHESISDEMTDSQIRQKAENLLKIKNRETKTLKLTCIGDYRLDVGVGVFVEIEALKNYGVNSREYIIMNTTNTYNSTMHTVELELQMQ